MQINFIFQLSLALRAPLYCPINAQVKRERDYGVRRENKTKVSIFSGKTRVNVQINFIINSKLEIFAHKLVSCDLKLW